MNGQELALVLGRLMDEWPNARWDDPDRPGAIMDNYAKQLLPLHAGTVSTAVEALIREGGDFPPTAGKVFRRVIELRLDAPTWAKVAKVIRKLNRTGYHQPGDLDPSRRERYNTIKDAAHPLIERFVTTVGGGYLYEAMDEGGNGEARVKAQWQEFLSDCVEQASLAGLPNVPGLRKLERANGPQSIGEIMGSSMPQLEAGEGEAA